MKLALAWIFALATAFVVVKLVKIGPVLFTVSEAHAMGVHGGDFLAVPGLLMAALMTRRSFDTRK